MGRERKIGWSGCPQGIQQRQVVLQSALVITMLWQLENVAVDWEGAGMI